MPLIVKPIQANITNDKDTFGKSDPYCIITIGNQKQRTRACGGGGKRPTWSETFSFTSTDQLLRVAVWDDDTFSDDMIGEGTLNLVQFYQNPGRTENEWVDLIHKGKSAGRIQLSVELQGHGNQWGGNQGGYNQGGYNQGPPPQWGGNQGGYNQGGYNQGGYNQGPPPQWGGNQGGYNQGGYNQGGYNQGPPQNQWGGNQGGYNQGGYNQGGQGGRW